ncbi:OprD family outer membrane porin, partial [Campylobacterota bacterium]
IPVEPVVEVTPTHTGSFGEALKNGKYSANMRLFYFDRSYDDEDSDAKGIPRKPNSSTFTFGGILKYESGDYNGFKFGLAYYGNAKVGDVFDRIDAAGASMLDNDGSYDDLGFLGEAYLQYDIGNTMFKVGRQQLATPLIQGHDLRLLPSVYEAAIIRNKDIPDTMIEVGFVDRYSGFGSRDNGFTDDKTSKDGLAYIYATNNSIENLSINGQYVKTLSDTNSKGGDITREVYTYLDAKYALQFGEKTYISAQYGTNSYFAPGEDDGTMIGAKVGTSFGMFDTALLYNKISDNAYQAFESGPMYSDWQQGYGPYDPSTAFGGQLTVYPLDGLSLKVAYVDVSADEGKTVDDFSEFNFDGQYTINDWSAFRVRYSIKDQTDTSTREDRDDLRVIYYLNF